MAILRNNWWDDQHLSKSGIRSMYDPIHHVVKFAHDYENFGQKIRVVVEVDAHRLEYENFNLSDLTRMFDSCVELDPMYIHEGPTTEDLENPAIRHAWEEFQIIYKLARKL